jgi:hypothetical protein
VAYDPYNDPNRIARQMAQQANETAQRMSRQAQESAQRAAAQAAATNRQFAEQNRQTALRAEQARRAREAGLPSNPSQAPESDSGALPSPAERTRGGTKGFVLFLLVIGLLIYFGTSLLG